MRNGEPIHFCSGGWKHRDDDCGCPCSFCRLYSQPFEVSPRPVTDEDFAALPILKIPEPFDGSQRAD